MPGCSPLWRDWGGSPSRCPTTTAATCVRERVVADRHDNELQWLECEYAAITGNMTERINWLYGSGETFDYDNMNRLTDIASMTGELKPW